MSSCTKIQESGTLLCSCVILTFNADFALTFCTLKWHRVDFAHTHTSDNISVSDRGDSEAAAFGTKLFFSLFVHVKTDLKLLPDRRSSKRWRPGCGMSFMMSSVLIMQRLLWRCACDCSSVPTTPCAVSDTHWRALLSALGKLVPCRMFFDVSVNLKLGAFSTTSVLMWILCGFLGNPKIHEDLCGCS